MASTKVCVVTGGNKGIGFAIVRNLCKQYDGVVYLTARDEGRGKAAVQELEKEGLSPKFHQLDIDNVESIKRLAKYIETTYKGLDVLVNNAAIAFKGDAPEPDGVQAEETIRVNYFGTLNVCHNLFPLLRPHARVVHVSSVAGHMLWGITGDEPHATHLREKLSSTSLKEEELSEVMRDFVKYAKAGTRKENGWKANNYYASKIGVSALTVIQQRAFDVDSRQDIIVNCCHPGYVDTDMTSHKGVLTIEQGSVAPVYLALLPADEKKHKGGFFWHDKQPVDWVKGPLPSHI